jgi:hypothetical protein
MKIAIFAVLMVVVLTLVESKPLQRTLGFIQTRPAMDDADELRKERGLNYKLSRATVHARSVVRYQTLKNVNERIFAETKYAGK